WTWSGSGRAAPASTGSRASSSSSRPWQQVAHSFGATSIPGIINTITKHQYVEVARGGRELNLSDLYKYATFAYDLPHGHVFQVKIPDVQCQNESEAANSSIQSAGHQFLNPDAQASTTPT